MVDWPRLQQWMNCLKDIVTEPRGYDKREFIKITLRPERSGSVCVLGWERLLEDQCLALRRHEGGGCC